MVSQGRSSDNSMNFTRNQWFPTSIFRFHPDLQKSIRKASKTTPKLNPKRCRSPSRNNVKKHAPKCTLFWSKRGSSFLPFSVQKRQKWNRQKPDGTLPCRILNIQHGWIPTAIPGRLWTLAGGHWPSQRERQKAENMNKNTGGNISKGKITGSHTFIQPRVPPMYGELPAKSKFLGF